AACGAAPPPAGPAPVGTVPACSVPMGAQAAVASMPASWPPRAATAQRGRAPAPPDTGAVPRELYQVLSLPDAGSLLRFRADAAGTRAGSLPSQAGYAPLLYSLQACGGRLRGLAVDAGTGPPARARQE